jgi:hypothetical protein
MSARPDPSGGYHESGIPTGITSHRCPCQVYEFSRTVIFSNMEA